MTDEHPSPQLDFVLELKVSIGPSLVLGTGTAGLRRMVSITGGTFSGVFEGRVLPGGADWQFATSDGLTALDAQYILEANDGTRIEVRNRGLRHGSPEIMRRLEAGEPVKPSEYYFRTAPRFYPPDGEYDWLRRSIFVGSAERYEDMVVLRVWKVR